MSSNNGPAHTAGVPRRYPCTICKREFRTEAGMEAHRVNNHKETLNASGARHAVHGKIAHNTTPKPKKAVSSGNQAVYTVSHNSHKESKDTSVHANKSWIEEGTDKEKVFRFKCPKWRVCKDIFPNFVQAYKHIQANHPQNINGDIVPPDSADMIKPVRVELCTTCNTIKKPKQKHKCEPREETLNSEVEIPADVLLCLGCKQGFSTKQMFNTHISQRHAHEVDSLFFTSPSDFNSWKSAMEFNTKAAYSAPVQHDGKNFYRCASMPSQAVQCPSTVVSQEYSTGIQVNFYHNHLGHTCRRYTLQDKFKKNSITGYLGLKPDRQKKLEDDLYARFKIMMESIIVEATKLDIKNLGLLHGMALDMTMVCNNFNYKDLTDDVDDANDSEDEFADSVEKEIAQPKLVKRLNSMVGKKIVSEEETITPAIVGKKIVGLKNVAALTSTPKVKEDEIVKMDEVRTSKRLKRKFLDMTPIQKVAPSKRDKRSVTICDARRDVTPDIDFEKITTDATIETTPKIVNTFSIKDDQENEVTPKSTPMNGKSQLTPSTFNDSYREFITSSMQDVKFKKKVDHDNKGSPSTQKVVVQTPEVEEMSGIKPVKNKYDGPSRTKPKTSGDASKSKPKGSGKKEKIRTQLGMFRPGSSPRSRAKSVDSPSPSKKYNTPSPKVKLDVVKYEVKEQENDCNILILKF